MSAFAALMDALHAVPGMLNLHVAIVSSDMGDAVGTVPDAGTSITRLFGNAGQCGQVSERGGGSCTASNLQAGATFISDVNSIVDDSGRA